MKSNILLFLLVTLGVMFSGSFAFEFQEQNERPIVMPSTSDYMQNSDKHTKVEKAIEYEATEIMSSSQAE